MYNCEHDYCPHLHFKKCMNARLQSIPYTIFPDATIDSFTNVPTKCTVLYKSNVPTTAYENHTLAQGSDDTDRNFVKNYYFNRQANSDGMGNTIVSDLKDQMATRSAYVLAGQESANFAEYQKNKKSTLNNARRRAVSIYNQHFKDINRQKAEDQLENEKWLKRLYRKLEQIAQHIVEGEGESEGDRQKMFLQGKTHLTPAYLGQIKVRNPKVACEMIEEIRTLMLKKKLKFEEQREEQQHNKSVSMSFASESGSQNVSQNSMLSQATSLNQSNIFGEDQVVGKYCDFQSLRKKWRVEDIEEVKTILRKSLTRQIVSDAELRAVKKRQQAQKNNAAIRRSLQKQGKSVKKADPKKRAQSSKKTPTPIISTPAAQKKPPLTKQQQEIKQNLLKGGQFDATGQKFQRNRNFSEMFKKRQQTNMVQFLLKEKTLDLTKDYCNSTMIG